MPHRFPSVIAVTLLLCLLAVMQQGCEQKLVSQQETPKAKCTTDKSQSPEARGFRLGMSLDQIQKRFSGLKVNDADEFGMTKIVLEGSKSVPSDRDVSTIYSDRILVNTSRFPEFMEVQVVALGLMDNRVTSIDITYPDEPKWGAYDVFAAHVAKSFNLPDEKDWNHGQGMSSITCNGFDVWAGFRVRTINRETADVRAYPFILIKDNDADKMLEERKQAKREKEKEKLKDFKP
ncbi:MAG TPA: hypothetical protein VF543_03010 [Pyrinomonadaceae bacterium]|jgi:hypothetical protein